MRIAPIDIAHKSFNRKVMGLDPNEVAAFLRDLADQMEELIRERNSLKEIARQKDIQLMEYKERDETLKATLATATKMSDQIRVDAEREAKLIIQDATQKAELVMRDGRDNLKRLYQEIADLKKLRMQFEANMRALCSAHIQMVESSHVSMPDPQINLQHAATVMSAAAPAPTQAHPHTAASGQQPVASAAPAAGNSRFRNPTA
ncbi:MAG TPA: DivIVA domain-containing protein [Pseudobdellovibrionaceae bacterium]|nr:DivIVA domain-containing protein [Pseudobdellovibrionaceae bacterium]